MSDRCDTVGANRQRESTQKMAAIATIRMTASVRLREVALAAVRGEFKLRTEA